MPQQVPYEQAVRQFREEQARFLRENPTRHREAWLRSLHFAESLIFDYDMRLDEAVREVVAVSRVTEVDGDEVTATSDPGVLHPGRLYFVESDARLAEGDVVSMESIELGTVLAVDAVFGGRLRRYGFTHGGTVKVTPQIMEQLGFSEVSDDPMGGGE